MSDSPLLNPDGVLLGGVASRLVRARKTKPIDARRLDREQIIQTLEGPVRANAGDYLCRGFEGELWPQTEFRLLSKYLATGEADARGWQRFTPRADDAGVAAVAVEGPFRIATKRGELVGHSGDYVVQDAADPSDVWIVARSIFDATYSFDAAAPE